MWFILGIIVLVMLLAIIATIIMENTENKMKILMTGYIIGAIVMFILGIRILGEKLNEQSNKINELTTELYESYNVRDSLEQEKE